MSLILALFADIQVRRAGEIVTTFDVYDLLMRGDPSGDIRLQSGDVLFVPTIDSVVEMRGEVRRPMAYELDRRVRRWPISSKWQVDLPKKPLVSWRFW